MINANSATFGFGKGKISCAEVGFIGPRVRCQITCRYEGECLHCESRSSAALAADLVKQVKSSAGGKGSGVGQVDPIRAALRSKLNGFPCWSCILLWQTEQRRE
jgi:hypothetical protein